MNITERLAQKIDHHFADPYALPVTVNVQPEEVRRHISERYSFGDPLPLEDVFADVDDMLSKWTEHGTHPLHFGLFRPTVDIASVIADALVAVHDPNLATWRFSPAAIEMENHVLAFVAKRLRFDLEGGIAHFTSGGQESNHTAIGVALTQKFPEFAGGGLRALEEQPVFYASEEGHHSLLKIAHSVGLGRDALRFVPAGDDLRMDVEALRRVIHSDRAAGLSPFLIVGTAGTTNAGIIDPLAELAQVAAEHDMWFHVDGAWGGAAAMSDRLLPTLTGIEMADSISCDAHKWFSVPVGAGMFFCRDRPAVEATFAADTAYAPPHDDDDRVYPYVMSMQWSRRFIGLKLFMMLAVRGASEVARRIEHQTDMGDRLREFLEGSGWQIVNRTPLPVVCFTHPTLEGDDAATEAVVRRISSKGLAWISKTVLRGRDPVLRACVTNFRTTPDDLEQLVGFLNDVVLDKEDAA